MGLTYSIEKLLGISDILNIKRILNASSVFNFKEVEDIIAFLDIYRDHLTKYKQDNKLQLSGYGEDNITDKIANISSTYSLSDREKEEFRKELSDLYGKYGVKYIADLVLKIAQSYTPVKTGKLRDSGRSEVDETNNTAKIIFGEGLDYAVYVHEIIDYDHPIGRAKFLEDAAYQVVNVSQVGNTPLFTFDIQIDNNLVICNINSIDQESFMNDLNKRRALFDMYIGELLE